MFGEMASPSTGLKFIKYGFLVGIGIPLIPLLAPFFALYLLFRFVIGIVEFTFKLVLRLFFPPLLVLDLWNFRRKN